MTMWQLMAPLWFDAVVVLGPKCRTVACLDPARLEVWWPGPAPILCCEGCAEYWQNVGRLGFGITIATRRLEYAAGPDDASQRASLLELH